MLESAHAKALPASSACTGTTTEMVYDPDGELGFAKRILADSVIHHDKVQWFTTLFGKLSSVEPFIMELKRTPGLNGNWAVTQFSQGPTQRWGVGWSFHDFRPSKSVCTLRTIALKGCSPPAPEQTIAYQDNNGQAQVKDILNGLPAIRRREITVDNSIIYEFAENVWSRAARRALSRGRGTVGCECQLSVLVHIKPAVVLVRWIRGRNHVMFESFCEMLRKKLTKR